MKHSFSEKMASKTDAELIAIVNDHRNDYQAAAITAAELELKKEI